MRCLIRELIKGKRKVLYIIWPASLADKIHQIGTLHYLKVFLSRVELIPSQFIPLYPSLQLQL